MSEHTKEPWSIAKHDASIVICYSGKQTKSGSTPYFVGGGALDDERNTNARRIVACVNACTGVDTTVLESRGFSLQIAGILALKMQRDDLKSENAQLLAMVEHWRAKAQADAKDAARYRWLRDSQGHHDFALCYWENSQDYEEPGWFVEIGKPGVVDAEIDAAMQKGSAS